MPRRPRMSSISRTKATQYKALINSPSLMSLEEVEVPEWHESITYITKNLNFPEGNGEQLIYRPYTNQIGSLQSSGGACLHPESSGSADVSVSVERINKHLSLAPLVKTKRMMLVLDLDHTLINSINLEDLSSDEGYLLHQISTKKDEGLLHSIEFVDCSRLVKLRPFVQQFLKEANNIFDLYVYTTGTRGYAIEIVKLLDLENKYFHSKVISRSDCTRRGQKTLNVIPESKACTIILDDKRSVWRKEDRENLIEMGAYNFFASSCQSSCPPHKSLSELKIDEREADGLASILDVLKHAHQKFLVMDSQITAVQPDVRSILKDMRK